MDGPCMNVFDLPEEDFEVFVKDNPEWTVRQLRSMDTEIKNLRIAASSTRRVVREMKCSATHLLPEPAPDVIKGWADQLGDQK